MRRWWFLMLLLLAPIAQAATVHAFLDRDHVSLGDTVTLNIQSDASISTPNLGALANDFEVLGSSASSSVDIVNGRAIRTTQIGIALKPLRAGTLTIPALDVDGTHTAPLTVHVAAAPAGGSGRVGDPAFMESGVLSSAPYVDAQTVYTVRLFYLPGVDGALGDPSADGARLIPLDRDHRYLVNRDGYTYKVLERSWALIPGRSGSIAIRGPDFQGQQMGTGNPGTMFIDPNQLLRHPNAILRGQIPGLGAPVQATAPTVDLDVRAQPANAGKPWLPARSVQLKLSGVPDNGRVDASAPLTLTLSIDADGQPAGALPEPELPPIAGARVYPDQARDHTDASNEWLHGTRSRSFAIVPDRDGRLVIPAITLAWWNVVDGKPEQAMIPARTLQVSGVVAAPASAAPPAAAATTGSAAAAPAPAVRTTAPTPRWRNIALASLVLWVLLVLGLIAWWRSRLRHGAGGVAAVTGADDLSGDGSGQRPVGSGAVGAPTATPVAAPDARALQRETLEAAAQGDAAHCERALCGWIRAVRPDLVHASDIPAALAAPEQRHALAALQRARWQGGDPASACAAVARAFSGGLKWRRKTTGSVPTDAALPPLYPS